MTNIPVQRNWRTNIVGQILTGNVQCQVSIDPNYVDDIVNPNEVANVADANKAFAEGETSVAIKEVEGTASAITMPKTVAAVNVSLPGTSTALTFAYPSDATNDQKPKVLNITVSDENAIDNMIFNLPNTTVYVNGKIVNATSSTANLTLIVTAGSTIEHLTVGKGNVSIEKGGAVLNIARAKDNVDAKTFVFVANGATRPATEDADIIFGSHDAYADYKVQYANDGNNYQFESIADACAFANSIAPSTTDIALTLTGDITWNTGGAGGGAFTMTPAPFTAVTINGNNHVFTAEGQGGIDGVACATVTFKNVEFVDKTAYTIDNGETVWEFTYLEFEGSKYVFNNCTFQNTIMAAGGAHTFNECRFNGKATLASNEANEYAVWVSAGETTFKECIFEGLYRGIKICDMYTPSITAVTIDGCTFKNISKKPGVAINLNDGTAKDGVVTIKNSSFTNVQPGDQHIFFYETDDAVNPTLRNNVLAVESAEELFEIAKVINEEGISYSGTNTTIKLMRDIDLKKEVWTPIGQTGGALFKGIFDGNNMTIKNLKIDSDEHTDEHYASGLFGWLEGGGPVIRNVKVDGAEVIGHHYVAVIAGYAYGTIENCHVSNATISCTSANDDANGDKCGAIVGYVGEDAKVKDCTAAASTISAGRDAGQVAGAAKEACVTGCSATDVTVTANGTSTGANIRNEVIGRVL